MSIQSKPDYKIFAQDAKSGEIETFPDILRGWGVTIDRTGEIPPMEWFNAIGKRADEWLLYLTQRGIPEWDASLDYPKSAMVMHSDTFYIAKKASKGESPDASSAAWSTLSAFLGMGAALDAKLDKTAVVQTTGQSTTNVMSQKAVTDAIPAVPENTASKSTNGWWKCADTGIIYQWGTVDYSSNPGEKNVTVSFPISFNVCHNVQATRKAVEGTSNSDGGINIASISPASFVADLQSFGSSVGGLRGFTWFAIGY